MSKSKKNEFKEDPRIESLSGEITLINHQIAKLDQDKQEIIKSLQEIVSNLNKSTIYCAKYAPNLIDHNRRDSFDQLRWAYGVLKQLEKEGLDLPQPNIKNSNLRMPFQEEHPLMQRKKRKTDKEGSDDTEDIAATQEME
jgi:hypothetical protein